MRKKSLVICILMLVVLTTGCSPKKQSEADAGQPAVQTAVPAEQPSEQEATETVTPNSSGMPEELQKQLIMENYSLWAYTEPWDSPWFYTFTDLDHNGRQEVIAATLQGTGLYTWIKVYEINTDYSGLVEVGLAEEDGFSYPDLIVDSLPCYYEEDTGLYYYVCEDMVRDGAARYYFTSVAFGLRNGKMFFQTIASKESVYTGLSGDPTSTCWNAEGNVISVEEYEACADRIFAGKPKTDYRIIWTQVENPWPEEEPDTAEISDVPEEPQVIITKNPTSEAIAIGGKTWFIAHADNASSLTWRMVAPDGTIYYSLDSAMAAHPGLKLEALEGDTLAVSNVPLSANGWGIVAIFENGASSAATDPAFLYVGDFLTPYSTVLDAYRAVYAQGEGKMEYAIEHGLSEIVCYSTGVGYALKDLDKNGIPELIIEGIGTDDFSNGIAYGIYTLADNQPVNLATSWARTRYYIRTDNTVLYHGSGGASHSYNSIMQVTGSSLEKIETVFTDYDEAACQTVFYYQQGNSDNFSSEKSIPLTEQEYTERLNQMESNIFIPILTKIA